MYFALIPAAGRSTRMGRPKLAMPFDDRPVLARVIAAFRAAGIDRVLVVIGPQVPELIPIATDAGGIPVPLTEPTPDMRSTVTHGLDWAEREWPPTPDDAWFLAPGDQPTLTPKVIESLIEQWHAPDRRFTIAVPTHDGERGHPTLIAWSHVAGIRGLPPDQGLNTYLRRHAAETLELPLDRPEILADMDTPGDYERLSRETDSQPNSRNASGS